MAQCFSFVVADIICVLIMQACWSVWKGTARGARGEENERAETDLGTVGVGDSG